MFSTHSNLEKTKPTSVNNTTLPTIKHDIPSSFLPPDVIKELSRELDQEMVELEFNEKVNEKACVM
jgi:hypothetical protein